MCVCKHGCRALAACFACIVGSGEWGWLHLWPVPVWVRCCGTRIIPTCSLRMPPPKPAKGWWCGSATSRRAVALTHASTCHATHDDTAQAKIVGEPVMGEGADGQSIRRIKIRIHKIRCSNVWIQDVLGYRIPASKVPGVPTKTRLESSITNVKTRFVHACFSRPLCVGSPSRPGAHGRDHRAAQR